MIHDLRANHKTDLSLGDLVIALILGAVGAYFVWISTGLGDHIVLLLNPKSDDVWFEADVMRVFANMTQRFSDHFRSQVHPLFSLFAYGATHSFGLLRGVGELSAARMTIVSSAFLWLVAFFYLLRLLQCRRVDATLFALAAATSASAIFWSAIPETYLFGSFTIVLALLVTALGERRPIPPWLDIGMAAAALSMLLSNWMVALFSLLARHKLKVAIQLGANAFVVVVFLWAIQKFYFPSAHFFLGDHEKWPHVKASTVAAIFFLDTMVMPNILSIPNDLPTLWPKLSVQGSYSWNLTSAGPIALTAWSILLMAGVWAAATVQTLQKFRLVLGLSIAGQLGLHTFYGNESYLYALNWLPLLVTLAALATQSRLRWVCLTAAVVFIVSGGYHNVKALEFAFDAVASRAS